MIFYRRPRSWGVGFVAATALMFCLAFVPSIKALHKNEPKFAKSPEDPALCARIAGLSPSISPDEARRVAFTAYNTGRDMAREWHVAWLPGIQNFLVNIGARK